MASKPTVIFVHGAWHGPDPFEMICSSIEAAGYHTNCVTLPSVGAPYTITTFEPDVAVIRAAIQEACSVDKDVMLFMHSYGGVPGGSAVKGLTKQDRLAEGKKGGISHLFFCAAWMLAEGESILGKLDIDPPKATATSSDPAIVLQLYGGPAQAFYGDLDDETQRKWVGLLKHQSFNVVFNSTVTYTAWQHVPSTYLLCTGDIVIPYSMQKNLVEAAKAGGAVIKTETLDASHSPFLSMPAEVVAAVRRAAGETV